MNQRQKIEAKGKNDWMIRCPKLLLHVKANKTRESPSAETTTGWNKTEWQDAGLTRFGLTTRREKKKKGGGGAALSGSKI